MLPLSGERVIRKKDTGCCDLSDSNLPRDEIEVVEENEGKGI